MFCVPLLLGVAAAVVALAMPGARLAIADTNLFCYEVHGVNNPVTGKPFYACDPFVGSESVFQRSDSTA